MQGWKDFTTEFSKVQGTFCSEALCIPGRHLCSDDIAMSSIYRPLDVRAREIRLMKIQPATFDAKIEGRLSHTSLDDPCQYEALSYRWGAIEPPEEISLDGQPFRVTQNLEAALRHLRDESGERTIWIDAVCINQADTSERNHQVSLMKDIYTRCTTDLAWLGPSPGSQGLDAHEKCPSDRELSLGLELMRNIAERDEGTLAELKYSKSRPRLWKDRFVLRDEQQGLLDAVLLKAPLWRRVWVMQELSCAPRVVLLAGKSTLDWDLIADFLGDTPYSDAFHLVWSHGSLHPAVSYTFEIAQLIQHQRGIVRDVAAGNRVSTLMDVLARFKFASSTDPRDKIFGLLGLVSEDHSIKVDYDKTAAQIFVDVCRFFIDSSRNLDIICQCPWQSDEGNLDVLETRQTKGLPSWVADFKSDIFSGIKDRFSALLFAQRGIFSAGTKTCETRCRVSESSGALLVKAIFIDTVGEILQPDYFSDTDKEWWGWWLSDPETCVKEWMELYLRVPSESDPDASWKLSPYKATGEPLIQAYWRTLVMDCKAFPIKRLDENEMADYTTLFAQLLSDPSPSSADEDLAEARRSLKSESMLCRNSPRWTFISSTVGLFCMVKKGVRAGDIVAVLDGGKVPVILRPVEGDGLDARFRFVTTAYVHGYMDGEAVAAVGNGKLERKDISLV